MIVCYSGGSILLDISMDVTVYNCECGVLSDLSLGVTVCCGGGSVLLDYGE